MKYLFYFLGLILILTAFYILILAIKTKKPIKFLLLNGLCGILILILIYLAKKFTGVIIPINEYTVIGCSTLGVPCAIGFLILNLILM